MKHNNFFKFNVVKKYLSLHARIVSIQLLYTISYRIYVLSMWLIEREKIFALELFYVDAISGGFIVK